MGCKKDADMKENKKQWILDYILWHKNEPVE